MEANRFAKVKVGAYYDPLPEAIAVLEEKCDCVCVLHVGFTFILYRDADLPRPVESKPKPPGPPGRPGSKKEAKRREGRGGAGGTGEA